MSGVEKKVKRWQIGVRDLFFVTFGIAVSVALMPLATNHGIYELGMIGYFLLWSTLGAFVGKLCQGTIDSTIAGCLIAVVVGFVLPAFLWFALGFVNYYFSWFW